MVEDGFFFLMSLIVSISLNRKAIFALPRVDVVDLLQIWFFSLYADVAPYHDSIDQWKEVSCRVIYCIFGSEFSLIFLFLVPPKCIRNYSKYLKSREYSGILLVFSFADVQYLNIRTILILAATQYKMYLNVYSIPHYTHEIEPYNSAIGGVGA